MHEWLSSYQYSWLVPSILFYQYSQMKLHSRMSTHEWYVSWSLLSIHGGYLSSISIHAGYFLSCLTTLMMVSHSPIRNHAWYFLSYLINISGWYLLPVSVFMNDNYFIILSGFKIGSILISVFMTDTSYNI